MSEHIRIGDIRPRVQYVGDGAVTTFSFPFPIFSEDDLGVFLGAARCTGGYAVAGAGESGGGNVTFAAAPQAGVVVTLARSVPIARTTDFQEGGAFRANVINEELDRLVCMAQQLREELDRAVRRSPTSTSGAALELPEPSPGRALKFAPDGALVASDHDPDAVQTAATAQAGLAAAARTAAEAARDQVLALYDDFDARYLGVYANDPETDNDGNPLFPGALYFQQTEPDAEGVMRVYTGAYWVSAYVNGAAILNAGNLLGVLAAFAEPERAAARAALGAASAAELDGLRDVPAVPKAAAYTLALSDRGRSVDVSDAASVTVPANLAVPFPVGSTVTVTNLAADALALVQGSGATLRNAGTAATGNRTLAGYGVATMRKVAADTWIVSGAGLL